MSSEDCYPLTIRQYTAIKLAFPEIYMFRESDHPYVFLAQDIPGHRLYYMFYQETESIWMACYGVYPPYSNRLEKIIEIIGEENVER